MSYLIENFKNIMFTGEKEEFGIKIGVNYVIIPVKLNKQENKQLIKDIEKIGYKTRQVDMDYLDEYNYNNIRKELTRELREQYKKGNSLAVTKPNTQSKWRNMIARVFIESVKEGIKIKKHHDNDRLYNNNHKVSADKIVNEIIGNTILRTKLKQHWIKEKEITEPKAEERIEYITTGKSIENEIIKEAEQINQEANKITEEPEKTKTTLPENLTLSHHIPELATKKEKQSPLEKWIEQHEEITPLYMLLNTQTKFLTPKTLQSILKDITNGLKQYISTEKTEKDKEHLKTYCKKITGTIKNKGKQIGLDEKTLDAHKEEILELTLANIFNKPPEYIKEITKKQAENKEDKNKKKTPVPT